MLRFPAVKAVLKILPRSKGLRIAQFGRISQVVGKKSVISTALLKGRRWLPLPSQPSDRSFVTPYPPSRSEPKFTIIEETEKLADFGWSSTPLDEPSHESEPPRSKTKVRRNHLRLRDILIIEDD